MHQKITDRVYLLIKMLSHFTKILEFCMKAPVNMT